MKKYLLALLVVLWAGPVFAVGTCVSTLGVEDHLDSNQRLAVRSITYVCTADSSAASYPSTAFSADTMAKLKGWMLITGSSKNGSTGPTASSVITLSSTNEGDILGGAGKTPPAATAALANKFKPYVDSGNLAPGLNPITHDLTLAITGNLVNSAVTTIVFKFVR